MGRHGGGGPHGAAHCTFPLYRSWHRAGGDGARRLSRRRRRGRGRRRQEGPVVSAAQQAPLVALRGLTVAYGDDAPALSAIDLDIRAGERLALIGESGSGKSTLALAFADLLPASAKTAGTIEWEGTSPLGGRDIGFVFQNPAGSLDPVMAVGRQVAEVARTHLGLSWPDALARACDLFGRVGLPDPDTLVHAFPHQLSGGQKQRVALAAAIAARPKLLIADEATSALDTIVQAEIVALIRRLAAEDGMTLLFVSHDIALAAELADRIAVLRGGRLMELGPTRQVIGRPQNSYTRSLIAAHIGLDSPPLFAAANMSAPANG
ncbi:ABC transporter ATP-binding protein [Mesorhizobium composti]|uniref:ABC transporter ATP-binding protein n=1 Tax=Ollibium composti TaxID=2675109 RepID=A0ABY2Q542_9HYPH|nr:ABC transporter ATP-binding protein [Mesorhizobium composti]